MERIKPTFPKPMATTARSEREELVQKFLDRINPGRESVKLKPLTAARFNTLVQGWGDKRGLYWLWSTCDHAKDFSKMFWWQIKQSKRSDK
jgi:hypothetical protein